MGKKHITYEERQQIEALFNIAKMKPAAIAAALGYSRQAIHAELKKGEWFKTYKHYDIKQYSADIAQQHIDRGKAKQGRPVKYFKDLPRMTEIERLIMKEHYSPAAALARTAKSPHSEEFCRNTIYNYIERRLFPKVRNIDLPEKSKRRVKPKYARRIAHKTLPSIEQRPEHISQRKEIGHWEMDLVIGKRKEKECLLTLMERRSRYLLIYKLPNRKSETINKAWDQIERDFPDFHRVFNSVTTDNGVEFLDYDRLTRSVTGEKRFDIYYCHSFAAWEKGGNENGNKMIRRWLKKGQSIRQLKQNDIEKIQAWANNYPRQVLGWKTAAEVFAA